MWDPNQPVENAREAMQQADDWLGVPQVGNGSHVHSCDLSVNILILAKRNRCNFTLTCSVRLAQWAARYFRHSDRDSVFSLCVISWSMILFRFV